MKKHILLIFLISSIAVLIHAQTMLPGFHLRQLNTEDGLPSNNVHEVVQDADGHTLGLLTMEDILEEIVGEIYDEDDGTPRPLRTGGTTK